MTCVRALGALALAASCTLFAGCASVRPANDLFAGAQRSEAAVTRYQGRFSARIAQGGAQRNAIGGFLWRETDGTIQLELMSPLGQTLAIISQSARGATLELPNQAPRHAPEPDALMQDALGFPIPVSGLRDWLRGSPAPDTPARIARDTQSRPEIIEQNGWTVHYVAWHDSHDPRAAGVRRLDLNRARQAPGDPDMLAIRLVLDPPAAPGHASSSP